MRAVGGRARVRDATSGASPQGATGKSSGRTCSLPIPCPGPPKRCVGTGLPPGPTHADDALGDSLGTVGQLGTTASFVGRTSGFCRRVLTPLHRWRIRPRNGKRTAVALRQGRKAQPRYGPRRGRKALPRNGRGAAKRHLTRWLASRSRRLVQRLGDFPGDHPTGLRVGVVRHGPDRRRQRGAVGVTPRSGKASADRLLGASPRRRADALEAPNYPRPTRAWPITQWCSSAPTGIARVAGAASSRRHGSSSSSAHRSDSSSKVVWAIPNGPMTSSRTLPVTAWASSRLG